MFSFLKPKQKKNLLYKDLIDRIETILYTKADINKIAFNSINKYMLLNMKFTDILELNSNITSESNKVLITSVSLEKFFNTFNGYIDLYTFLNRIKSLLEENKKLNSDFIDDLNEIITALEFLLGQEENGRK